MKRLLLALLLALAAQLAAQNHQFVIADTAAHVVDTYLRMLNIDELPEDSLLVMETAITVFGVDDTLLMRRWFARPQMFRVEVWHGDSLQYGLCSNGKDRYRKYFALNRWWDDITPEMFHDEFAGYDFRGPLYNWRAKGGILKWVGLTRYDDYYLQTVHVDIPGMYERIYMFDPDNSLLTLIIEPDNRTDKERLRAENSRIDWKVFHEYTPVGTTLLPSQESFMRHDEITILNTTYRLAPRDTFIFNRDR